MPPTLPTGVISDKFLQFVFQHCAKIYGLNFTIPPLGLQLPIIKLYVNLYLVHLNCDLTIPRISSRDFEAVIVSSSIDSWTDKAFSESFPEFFSPSSWPLWPSFNWPVWQTKHFCHQSWCITQNDIKHHGPNTLQSSLNKGIASFWLHQTKHW